MAEADTIITATLVRGKVYSLFNEETQRYDKFARNVPTEVKEELADILEAIVEVVTTTDGDEIEKQVFEIDRDAERRTDEDTRPRRMRLRMVAVDDDKAKAKTVATRQPVRAGTGLKVGSGRR